MTIQERVDVVLREVLDQDTSALHDDMTAGETESWDSFAHVNLMAAIEEEFQIEVSMSDYEKLQSVKSIRRFVAAATGGR